MNKRPLLSPQDIYDSYSLMYIFLATKDPSISFDCLWTSTPIKEKFLNELENICLREFRHIGDECNSFDEMFDCSKKLSDYEKEIFQDVEVGLDEWKLFRKEMIRISEYLRELYGCEDSFQYDEAWTNIPKLQQKCRTKIDMKKISLIFDNWLWTESFGGRKWSKIAKVTHLLRTATPFNFFYTFDRTVDYVHNSGRMITKLNTAWGFRKALNIKAQTPTIKELIPLCSSNVRQIYAKSMKCGLFWVGENSLVSGVR